MHQKLTVLFSVPLLVIGITGYSQRVTISSKDSSTVIAILSEVRTQTGYDYFCSSKEFDLTLKSFFNVKKAPLETVLDLLFRDKPYSYIIRRSDSLIDIVPRQSAPVLLLTIRGKVINDKKQPAESVTVTDRQTSHSIITNAQGEFEIKHVAVGAIILFTHVNMQDYKHVVMDSSFVQITMQDKISELDAVPVVSNGYQYITEERATGSFGNVGKEKIGRNPAIFINNVLEGILPGLVRNKGVIPGSGLPLMTIRGLSSIHADQNPLFVIDNFPVEGDITNLPVNPNDIENITVLKDAAAASIWGVRAGNGVVVITTKKGKFKQGIKIESNNSITIGSKPDVFYQPVLGSREYVELMDSLVTQDFYSYLENSPFNPALSPVHEALIARRDGKITNADADQLINTYKITDNRKDVKNYFYRNSISHQHSISVSAGNEFYNFLASGGYDQSYGPLINTSYNRKTLYLYNSFAVTKKLNITTSVGYIHSLTHNNNDLPPIPYLYSPLVGVTGNALTVPMDIRQAYKDTAGNGALQDWNYRPYDDVRQRDNNLSLSDVRINFTARYKFTSNFDAKILYHYNKGQYDLQNNMGPEMYYTRNLVNSFSQNASSGIDRIIPNGTIRDEGSSTTGVNNTRLQLGYNPAWNNNSLMIIGGAEVRKVKMHTSTRRLYGVNNGASGYPYIDYQQFYPLYFAPGLVGQIPDTRYDLITENNFISWFFNASHTLMNRYIFSVSMRKDESNIFGATSNHKGIPLGSLGLLWDISQEAFYKIHWLPVLKLRTTIGYGGNIDNNIAAVITSTVLGNNVDGSSIATLNNPPNPDLRWEKVRMINIGLDFAFLNKSITGSLEYYNKKSDDLFGTERVDPSTGNRTFTGNVAAMKGWGIDMNINTININSKSFKWQTNLQFSYTNSKVTSYKDSLPEIWMYSITNSKDVLPGKPPLAIMSIGWAGLDPQTGDPQGYYKGQVSKNYNSIVRSSDPGNLVYNGPSLPPFFASLYNELQFNHINFSCMFTWKGGHYFRRNSISYIDLLYYNAPGHTDYNLRWRKPGDEKRTNIPSINYDPDDSRDIIYRYSEILVEKADRLRLEDIRLGYEFTGRAFNKLPIANALLYVYCNNPGLIWKANHKDIDPDYINSMPEPLTISIGIKAGFNK